MIITIQTVCLFKTAHHIITFITAALSEYTISGTILPAISGNQSDARNIYDHTRTPSINRL